MHNLHWLGSNGVVTKKTIPEQKCMRKSFIHSAALGYLEAGQRCGSTYSPPLLPNPVPHSLKIHAGFQLALNWSLKPVGFSNAKSSVGEKNVRTEQFWRSLVEQDIGKHPDECSPIHYPGLMSPKTQG